MRYVLFVVFVIACGAVAGFVIGQADETGYFEQWQMISTPLPEIAELVASGRDAVYANTLAGETYSCKRWMGECWVQDKVPPDTWWHEYPWVTMTKPCDFASPEFSVLAKPPEDVVDCIQSKTEYADGWMKYAHVLDGDGCVWEWSHAWGLRSSLGYDCCSPMIGLVPGSALGIILWLQRRIKNR